MTASLILFGSPLSPFQRKVEAVMALKGLDYDCQAINIMAMPDWYLAISPLARIPALRDTSIAIEGLEAYHPSFFSFPLMMWPDGP